MEMNLGEKMKEHRSGIALNLVVIAIIIAVIFVMALTTPKGPVGGLKLTVNKGWSSQYITWTVTSLQGDLLRSDVCITLKNASGIVINDEKLLSASGTHGFLYTPAQHGDSLSVGDVFSLSKDYDQGCQLYLVAPNGTDHYASLLV